MTLKKLLISSAAVIGAGGTAQAADFIVPVAEPVDYVTYCDTTAGQGIAVTANTCIRIGGRVRFTINFGENTSPASIDNAEAGDWRFTTDARIDVRASRETDYGWLESFVRFTGTSNNNNDPNYAVELSEAWIRFGWLQVGVLGSLFEGIASDGYIGGGDAHDQIRLIFENGAWTFSLAAEDPRDRAFSSNEATMDFPDILAQLDGEIGPFEARLAAGWGSRTINDVWGILASLELGVGTGGEIRLNGAYGQNGFDFVANTLGGTSGLAGGYWAAAVAYNQVWNPMWESNIAAAWADGPATVNGRRRVVFSTTYQPLGNNHFQISKEIQVEQREVGDTFDGQDWNVTGFLRFTRNFP
jgi:hypothetical protein